MYLPLYLFTSITREETSKDKGKLAFKVTFNTGRLTKLTKY